MADRFASRGYSLKKQTRWSNDKTIIELGYRKISWFVSVSQINYLPQPSASANNWSARHRQITIFCSTWTVPQGLNRRRCKSQFKVLKGTSFLVKMIFICKRMKTHLRIKGWALKLVLIQRPGVTRKWSSAWWVKHKSGWPLQFDPSGGRVGKDPGNDVG